MSVSFQIRNRLQAVARYFIRQTSKIAVEVDPRVLEKLKNEEIKFRRHPGIIKTGPIELPSNIISSLERAIGDYPVKQLLNDCHQLNKYINARHPPAERDDLESRMRYVVNRVDRKMPLDTLTQLSEEEAVKWTRKRENEIRKQMARRTYAWKPIYYGTYEALTYAIGRGAQEFGVLVNILHEIQSRHPTFKPRSYFDFGSGVGTGMWATSSLWKDSIFEYYNVDSSREMNDFSELVLREGNENQEMTLRNVYYRQFLPAKETMYDLVLSSYSLFELPSAESRKDVILNLWNKCNGYLIIVEEGTRRGSELVNEARDFVLNLQDEDLNGEVFAPCPHNLVCPRLSEPADRSPCNFELSYVPLKISNIKDDRQTVRYSYVVLKKGEISDETRNWPRLVRPTLLRSKHVICRMCTNKGKLQEVIFTKSKHGSDAYRCAKVSKWGNRLPMDIGQPLSTAPKIQDVTLPED